MDAVNRIEKALGEALDIANGPGRPPRLAEAMHYAVFPRGARVRPRLVLAAAAACGDDSPALTDAAAAAIELLHCASLVHDDLPCFDDAAVRRGKPALHVAYGEPLAVLAGDALIVLAFQVLARAGSAAPHRLPGLLHIIGDAVGMPMGIAAGQAWECEPRVDLGAYQRAKTASLFSAATMSGAAAAGAEPEAWRRLGEKLGEAYQVADDLRDALADEEEAGKTTGRDAVLGRPSAALTLGIPACLRHLEDLIGEAIEAIPPCPGRQALEQLILLEARRLVPKAAAAHAA